MTRRAHRKDSNHPAIAARYRQHGCSVMDLADAGLSVDLLIGCRGIDCLVEVKDGEKPPSRRRLTTDEQELHDAWRGRKVRIIEYLDEVDAHVAELRREANEGLTRVLEVDCDIPRVDLT